MPPIKNPEVRGSPMPPEAEISSSALLSVERRGAVALLHLARPEKRNALNDALITALGAFFAAPPEGVRVAIVAGHGAHFSAGLDLSDITEKDATAGMFHSRLWHRAFRQIAEGTLPVIAVLHGAVIGGGLELASACHVRVAERSAYYALPEGQRGIFVGGGGSVRLPRLIGLSRMTDMMLTGRVFSAEEGQAIGLSNYLVEDGAGLALALDLAAKVAANAPLTNFAVLHALPRIAEADREGGFLAETLMAGISVADQEAKARLHAFLEGRAAKIAP